MQKSFPAPPWNKGRLASHTEGHIAILSVIHVQQELLLGKQISPLLVSISYLYVIFKLIRKHRVYCVIYVKENVCESDVILYLLPRFRLN